jgi:metallophosphoesterase superfamily enzyme
MPPPTRETTSPAEVFVVSDLHVGGEYGDDPRSRGFRINTRIQELTDFMHEVRLRAQRTHLETELVINGDFVDFLAEKGADEKRPWRAFISDEDEAVTAL